MFATRSLKEQQKWWKLQRFVGNKIMLGHLKQFTTIGYGNDALYYACFCFFYIRKTKYLIPVAEMNLYDGIAILYEAQLDRDAVGAVSLCDDVLSVVRGFLEK